MRHGFGHIAVGGGNDADVERNRLLAAHPLDFALLQHAQQLGLQAERHFRDFVEQQVPACACSNLPACACWAPVKAPFS